MLSVRTLKGKSPMSRDYGPAFEGRVRPGLPPYEPASEDCPARPSVPYSKQRIELYKYVRELFPAARAIGYVPPQSVWRFLSRSPGQDPRGYSEVMFEVARQFDQFFDFAVPSATTARRDNTYDGSHYDEQTNALIARSLSTGMAAFGYRVDILTKGGYQDAVIDAVEKYRPQYEALCGTDVPSANDGDGR
jgi:hypothetical protein